LKSAGLEPQTELSANRTAILRRALSPAVVYLAIVFRAVAGLRGSVSAPMLAAVLAAVPSQRFCFASILICLVTRSWLPPFCKFAKNPVFDAPDR